MGVIAGCRFDTDRLEVLPWHDGLRGDALAEFVAALLTPKVVAGLPPGWQGSFDVDRAHRWVGERDGESTVLLAADRSAGAPIGLLIVAADDDRSERHLRIGYLIEEAQWGRGFATELVGGFVRWCRERGSVRSLSGGVETVNRGSARVLAKQGFEVIEDLGAGEVTYRLEILPDTDVLIRPEATEDVSSIRRAVVAAFGSPVEGALVDRIRASPEFLPDLSLIAEVDGEIVGHVMISGATLRHAAGEREIVMLSPLAVAPQHQRRGIGAQLVMAALDGAEQRGEPLVVIEGNPAYYGRFGFEHAIVHGLTLPLPDWAPSEAGQVRRLSGYDASDPSLRGVVVYPAAFDGVE